MNYLVMSAAQWLGSFAVAADAIAHGDEVTAQQPGADVAVYQRIDTIADQGSAIAAAVQTERDAAAAERDAAVAAAVHAEREAAAAERDAAVAAAVQAERDAVSAAAKQASTQAG